jgi:hypothetical protein
MPAAAPPPVTPTVVPTANVAAPTTPAPPVTPIFPTVASPMPMPMPMPMVEDPWAAETHQVGPVWSSAMDSVLIWSWQSGVDLMVVANELCLDLRAVLQRVQTLAGDGRLARPEAYPTRTTLGRHRRYEEDLVFADAVSGEGDLYPPAGWT